MELTEPYRSNIINTICIELREHSALVLVPLWKLSHAHKLVSLCQYSRGHNLAKLSCHSHKCTVSINVSRLDYCSIIITQAST